MIKSCENCYENYSTERDHNDFFCWKCMNNPNPGGTLNEMSKM